MSSADSHGSATLVLLAQWPRQADTHDDTGGVRLEWGFSGHGRTRWVRRAGRKVRPLGSGRASLARSSLSSAIGRSGVVDATLGGTITNLRGEAGRSARTRGRRCQARWPAARTLTRDFQVSLRTTSCATRPHRWQSHRAQTIRSFKRCSACVSGDDARSIGRLFRQRSRRR